MANVLNTRLCAGSAIGSVAAIATAPAATAAPTAVTTATATAAAAIAASVTAAAATTTAAIAATTTTTAARGTGLTRTRLIYDELTAIVVLIVHLFDCAVAFFFRRHLDESESTRFAAELILYHGC